jgi:small subunit ribosomal protein S20
MPNTKSAAKRLRQNILRRASNRSVKRDLRTRYRKVIAALEGGKPEEARTLFRDATKKLDQAAAKRVIHRNAAARLKSRLAARMKQSAGKGQSNTP